MGTDPGVNLENPDVWPSAWALPPSLSLYEATARRATRRGGTGQVHHWGPEIDSTVRQSEVDSGHELRAYPCTRKLRTMQYLTTRKPRNPLPPPGCYQDGTYSDMSRTYRRNPGPAYMRTPRGKRAMRAALQDGTDELMRHPNRRAIPPDAWDDLTVSSFRGQRWHRAWKAWYRAPIGTPVPPDYS